ncbi:TonB-dependent receptor domain-containing protein [Gemmatimonas groenlandica]|uniref:TonB-dependent receptor n=1 Tax=Gemmatimonas groenlandica TaxID=2732249 RepID=A0A6M4ISN9_9BACT|nr:TonB-dependent receptor [Gemmatimonas groenlandica]QJR37195.1 TonB-dependent receptor [Gemmatimonas groenlandica]
MTLRSVLSLILSLCLAQATFTPAAFAQSPANGVTLFGKVQDAQTKAALPFLTLQMQTEKDSAFVSGRLTNEQGAFTFTGLKKGTYVLVVRSIGYQPIRQRVLIGELSAFLDLGAILMVKEVRVLGDVKVTANADAVAGTMDKKTFTVSDNISQSGGSVLQAMSTLPGVTVAQDGKVQVRGSDKVVVLIDGKQTALTGFGSQNGLDNLPASALERIEIINNPSAKFDANASAGIINLIFKKQEQEGFNGKIGVMGGAGALWVKKENLPTIRPQYQGTPKFNPSVAVNYRKGATNSFLQADWLYSPTLNKNEFSTRTYDDGTVIIQQIKRNRRTDYATLNGGVDHTFDERNTFSVSGLFNREKILDNGDNPYFSGTLQNRYRLWQFLEDEVKYTAFGSAVLTHKFQEPGHSLVFTSNYSFHREDEKYFFTNTVPSFVGTDAFKLLSDEHVVDFNADYTKPLKQGRVEAGFKGRYRSIPVNMQFFAGRNSPLDTGAGGWATYRETIPALYGTYVFESQRVELEGGVRFEQVQVDYDVNPDHNTYKSDGYRYFQPFPNVRAAYKFDDANKLSLFFNRRVDRPNEVDIRIFPKYDEPELIKVGNPALQPQYSTSSELGYKTSWSKGSVYASAYHRIVDGTITRIATQAPGSVLLYNVFQNGGRSRSTGTEVVWQQTISRRLSLSANANAFRRNIDAFAVVNQYPVPVLYAAERQTLTSGNGKLNATIKLPHDWQTQISQVYLAPDLLPQGRIGSRYSLDLGMKKSVQQGRGEIVVNATDLLNTMQAERTIRGTNFRLVSTDYLETQVVRVGYSWKF